MTPAVAYLRVSTDDQGRSGLGIEAADVGGCAEARRLASNCCE
jgi:DNA invertase Pin-like site-specific DNA recombinase